jgi:peptidyl-prolyl cis-trans isomerase C
MKRVHRASTQVFAALIASACPLISTAADAALTPTIMNAPDAHPSAIVATVNDKTITQSDLDEAVASSKERDTVVLRHALKHRLIALQLLWLAAEKRQYANGKALKRQATRTERTVEIQLYLRDVVRPAPVTDADVRARYWQIVKYVPARTDQERIRKTSLSFTTRAPRFFVDDVPVTLIAVGDTYGLLSFSAMTFEWGQSFDASQVSIRVKLETERFDEAIRALVEDLMAQADINE